MVRDIDTRRDLNARYAAELFASQQRLQAVVAGLAGAESATLPIGPFKGDLDWPVPGTLRRGYGAGSQNRPASRGIEIGAPEHAAVHALHDGMVAYAGAFAGFGRLVIVDHGSQTFTLYGNLGEMTVQRGARIRRGESLGTVGLASDGTAGIYFELRIDGQPVDPLQWLVKR
jgi:septal ring factor EnvC (AmiA/AmiB activator)